MFRLKLPVSAFCLAVLLGAFALPASARAYYSYDHYGYAQTAMPYGYGNSSYGNYGYGNDTVYHQYAPQYQYRTNVHVQPTVTVNRHVYTNPHYEINENSYGGYSPNAQYGYGQQYNQYGSSYGQQYNYDYYNNWYNYDYYNNWYNYDYDSYDNFYWRGQY